MDASLRYAPFSMTSDSIHTPFSKINVSAVRLCYDLSKSKFVTSMTNEEKNLLMRYLDLRAQLLELEEEIEKLKPAVFDILDEEAKLLHEKRIPFNGFEFEVRYRTTYEYSPEVKALEEQLKALKKQEEKNGCAVVKSQVGFVRVTKANSNNPT